MIKCNLCYKKFYDVMLDEDKKGNDIFYCYECFGGKIKHRVYIDKLKVKNKQPKKIEVMKKTHNIDR